MTARRCAACRRRLRQPTPDGLGPVCRRKLAPTARIRTTTTTRAAGPHQDPLPDPDPQEHHMPDPDQPPRRCLRTGCDRTPDVVASYCSDTCLRADVDARRQAGIASWTEWNRKQAEAEREALKQRAARHREALARINADTRPIHRQAMTPEERAMVSYTALVATTDQAPYQHLSRYADEAAQTTRLDVLRSRAYHQARADRKRNGWAYGDTANTTDNV